jgi:hypothetical protein
MDPTRPTLPRLAAAGLVLATAPVALLLVVLGAGDPDGADGPPAASAAAPAPTAPAPSAPAPSTDGWVPWAVDTTGAPVRWDPCTPIEVVLRPAGAPDGAEADLRAALDRLAAASGLDLRLVGTTDAAPSADGPLVERTDTGWRWAPVLVAWDLPGVGGMPLGPHDRGVAVPVAVRADGREAFVTGQVVLNAARTDLRPGFGDRAHAWGATLLHELGHLLGLDHVEDAAQLMAADPGSGPVALGAGDLAGLAAVGAAGGCVAAPPPTPGLDAGIR